MKQIPKEVRQEFHYQVRGGLQLSDISENPNNDRIGGDPPTHPPNPNKCLMLDVFMVLHIPGVNRLLPTISTVQGVNSSFIPTENGDERLDCMYMCCCNYHWPKTEPYVTGRGWTRLLWRWHYPGKSVSIRLEQISRSPTCLEFSPTAKEHLPLRKMDCRLIGCFEKRTLP